MVVLKKQKLKLYFLLIGIFFALTGLSKLIAQTNYYSPNTSGTDFWFAYGFNGNVNTDRYLSYQVRIVAGNSTSVTIERLTPHKTYPGYCNSCCPQKETIHFEAGEVKTIDFLERYESPLPDFPDYKHRICADQFCYMTQTYYPALMSDQPAITNPGIGTRKHWRSVHITATEPVSVYALSHQRYADDGTVVFPTDHLGTDYYHISYLPSSWMHLDGYLIIATEPGITYIYENGVQVDSINSSGKPGRVMEKYLSPKYSPGFPTEMTGTHITTSKPVAFFVNNQFATVPIGLLNDGVNQYLGHNNLFQQIPPVREWGVKFFVPVTDIYGRERVRIVASQNGTNITCYNGEIPFSSTVVTGSAGKLTNLKAGEWVEIEILSSNKGSYITANKPVGVCSYIYSNDYVSTLVSKGNPSMCWIPPIEQSLRWSVVAPFIPSISSESTLDTHKAIIVAKTENKDRTKMALGRDNPELLNDPNGWINNVNGYSYYIKQLNDKSQTYYFANDSGMLVLGYGYGEAESYYYPSGQALRQLFPSFYINDIHYQDIEGKTLCGVNQVTLSLTTIANYNPQNFVHWEIRDYDNRTLLIDSKDNISLWTRQLESGHYFVSLRYWDEDRPQNNAWELQTHFWIKHNTSDRNSIVANDLSVCNGVSTNLNDLVSVVADIKNPVFHWYYSKNGVMKLPVPPKVTLTTGQSQTYWVSVEGDDYCEGVADETGRHPVKITVNSPTPPEYLTVSRDTSTCPGTFTTLTASSDNRVKDPTILWYDSSNASAVPVGIGPIFKTSPLMSTTTFYVNLLGSNYCGIEASKRKPVKVTVGIPSAPAVPSANLSFWQYSTAPDLLRATGLTTASGYKLKWYESDGKTEYTGVNNPINTIDPGLKTYYVSQVNEVNGCESNKAPVYILIVKPKTLQYIVCPESTVNLEVETINSVNYYWYSSESGGTALPGSPSNMYKVTNASPPETYWIEPRVGTSTFKRLPINIALNPNCGSNPSACMTEGTLLFREDFDGDNVSYPDLSQTVIYQTDIDNLCKGMKLSFSAWFMYINSNDKVSPVIEMQMIDRTTGTIIVSSGGQKISYGNNWTKLGYDFQLPASVTNVRFKIINEEGALNDNSMKISNIEVRFCAPLVLVPSGNILECEGSPFKLTGSYTDDGTFGNNLKYRWEYSLSGNIGKPSEWSELSGSGGSVSSGKVLSSLAIPAVMSDNTGFYRFVVGNESTINTWTCRAASRVVALKVIKKGSSIVWSPETNSGDNKQDWNNPANWMPAVKPLSCHNVYIPGNSTHYPVLTDTTEAECSNIYFIQGAELGRPDLLTYEKARIQYNFGLLQTKQITDKDDIDLLHDSNSSTSRMLFSAATSKPLDRERWYMLSSPLHGIVTGDLGFGGFPLTFLKKFGPIEKDNVDYLVGKWTTNYTSMTDPVTISVTDGFAYYMYGYSNMNGYDNTGCGESGAYNDLNDLDYLPADRKNKKYGIKEINGILELPFFEDSVNLYAHRTQVYDSLTNQSKFYTVNDGNYNKAGFNELMGTNISIKREDNRGNYRFAPEKYNPVSKKWEFRKQLLHPVTGLTNGDVFLTGNPYMSSIDIIPFYLDNANSIYPTFHIWNGNSFDAFVIFNADTGEIVPTNPDNSNRYIAPLQGFFLAYKGLGNVLFDVENISAVRPAKTLSNLRNIHETNEENILRIKAENDFAATYALIGYHTGASRDFIAGEDVQKLFSPYGNVPEIYSLANEIPVGVNFAGNDREITFPLGIRTGQMGKISLIFTGMDHYIQASKIELIDALENQTVDLTGLSSYTYTFNHKETGIHNGRFSIRIGNTTTAFPDLYDSNDLKVYGHSKGIYVVSSSSDPVQQVIVYDFQGKKLYESKSSTGYYPLEGNIANSPLIVKAVTKNQTKTVKINSTKQLNN